MLTLLIFGLVGAVLAGLYYLFTRDAYLSGYARGWDECTEHHDYPTSNIRAFTQRDAA